VAFLLCLLIISNYGLIDTSAVVGTALNIKSILAVDIDGNIKLIEKVSGRKRAISKVIQIIRQTGQNIADNPIFVSDSMIKSDAEFLTSTLREYYGNELRILGDSVTPSNVAVLGKGVMSVSFRVYKKVH